MEGKVKMFRRTPIIVILGSTATGKTKLSIELARKFGGEIISADSMQIYKGLDISTAKATACEQSQAVHHMLDVCDATTTTFTVVDFRDAAIPIINNLLTKDKIPIIIGGTNYYIESLLWKNLVRPPQTDTRFSRPDFNFEQKRVSSSESSDGEHSGNKLNLDNYETATAHEILSKLSPDELCKENPSTLHDLLQKIDPASAKRLHPNDERKVRRALEVYMETGKCLSDIYSDQRREEGGNYLGGPLRYEHLILFWLKSDQSKLDERIDKRIDGMIAQGLLPEIRKCFKILKTQVTPDNKLDCTRGMLQAIGFKEFVPYLEKYGNEELDDKITRFITSRGGLSGKNISALREKPEGLDLLEKGLEDLRLRTKRYAKTQIKWIKNRLLFNKGRLIPPLYELDATRAETNWKNDVFDKAENIVQSYIDGIEPELKPTESTKHPNAELDQYVTHFCKDCDRRFIGDFQWRQHINSRKHQKIISSLRRKERLKVAQMNIVQKLCRNIGILWENIRNRLRGWF